MTIYCLFILYMCCSMWNVIPSIFSWLVLFLFFFSLLLFIPFVVYIYSMHIYCILVRTLYNLLFLALGIYGGLLLPSIMHLYERQIWFDFRFSFQLLYIKFYNSYLKKCAWLPVHIWLFFFLLRSRFIALFIIYLSFFFFSLVDMDAAEVHYFTSGWICMNLCIFQELTLALMVNKLILSTTQISSVAIFYIFHFVHKMYRFRCGESSFSFLLNCGIRQNHATKCPNIF